MAGVTSGAKSVESKVNVTERIRLAFERYAITFDAVPPGQAPTKTIPIKISSESPNVNDNNTASSGITINCIKTPSNNRCLSVFNFLKSAKVSDTPMPNIITPSSLGMCGFIHTKPVGCQSATIVISSTMIIKYRSIRFCFAVLLLFIICTEFRKPTKFFYEGISDIKFCITALCSMWLYLLMFSPLGDLHAGQAGMSRLNVTEG